MSSTTYQVANTQAQINQEMYGVADIETLVNSMDRLVAADRRAMTPIILDMLAEASDTISIDPISAKQTINRIRLLIVSSCPLLKEPVTEEGVC